MEKATTSATKAGKTPAVKTSKATSAKTTTAAKPAVPAKAKVTAASKPAAPKPTAPKTAVANKPTPVVVSETSPNVVDPALKKKELIDLVTEHSGIKKKDAKPVIEAMLEILGKTLSDGREINLQPLGKIKINRAKDVQGGKVMVTKIRQSNRTLQASDDSADKPTDT